MQATFYVFAKRVTSTARPTGGTQLSITLKGECSIIAPVITIKSISDPTQYNYLYIPDFKRYYFVNNWTWTAGLWQATCKEDALATWRTEISNSTEYVVRSSAKQDGTIIDNLYPCKTIPKSVKTEFDTGFLKPTGTDAGKYVLGVVSKNANSFGGVTYYAMSGGNMRALMHKLLDDISYTEVSETELSAQLEKVLFDPTEYIKSSIYIPYNLADILANAPLVKTIEVGWWSFDIPAWIVGGASGAMVDTKVVTINMPQHPQALDRGNYVNASPYMTRELYYPPFGVIPINTALTCAYTVLRITTQIEITTGNAACRVVAVGGATVAECYAQVGVPIRISRIALSPDFSVGGAIKTGAAALAGGLTKFFSGQYGDDVVNGILDGAQAANATVTGTGSSGSVLPYYMDAYLITTYYTIVDDDNEHRGRPLCKKLRLGSLMGYMMIADPDITLPSTSAELDEIRTYMTTGFYLE